MLGVKETISLGIRVIVMRDDKVLVIRQRKPNGQDVYILPGGGIEEGEDIFTAAKREVIEESFLKIEIQKLLYIKELFSPYLHSFEFYVLGKIIKGKPKLGYDPELSKDHQVLKEITFIPLENLKKLRFYPQELRTRLKKDARYKFKNRVVYLGCQRFTPKQFKRLFGGK